ncbi:MAG: hypothetical protein RSF82_10060 [Angelakisella sp.]
MNYFAETPTMQIATATEFGEKLVTHETAVCCYWLDGMSIYRAADESYYFHLQPDNEKEFFPNGQIELVEELEPVDEYYNEQLRILSRDNRKAQACGLSLVTVLAPDVGDPSFVLYHSELQAYFLFSNQDFQQLTSTVSTQLVKLSPSVNRLSSPYKAIFDDMNAIIRLEMIAV